MGSSAAVSPWSSAESRARDRADKREAVLRAAAQLFNEKGFHATSLDEVAEQCIGVLLNGVLPRADAAPAATRRKPAARATAVKTAKRRNP